MVADCAAVKSVLDSVSTQFPDGPNLTVGQPPSETNVQALTAIRDGFTGLTLTWPAVMKRVEGSLKAINAILASPTAPLSQKVVDRFNSAGSKLADACVGAS